MKKMLVVLLGFVLLGVVPVMAEETPVHPGSFASHVDLLQPYQMEEATSYIAAGYHFTTLKFGRFRTLGAGFAVGVFTPDHNNPSVHRGEYLGVVPVADIRLTTVTDSETPDIYFNVKYIYSFTRKNHSGALGFSLSW